MRLQPIPFTVRNALACGGRSGAGVQCDLAGGNSNSMRQFSFEAKLWLPRKREEIFPFFANAENLEVITPPWVNFKTLTPTPITMKPGALIDYKLRIHGIPIRWRTEITVWEPSHRFVDEQLRGPYRQWIHEHRFEDSKGGTLCTDSVRYAVWGGGIVDRLFVRRDVETIFAFRNRRLLELFGDAGAATDSVAVGDRT